MRGCASSTRLRAGIPTSRFGRLLSGPDALQHISIYCAGGKCPDVLMAWEFTYAGLANRGVLLDLNTMLAHDTSFAAELKADSIASLYETFTFDGGQYAFPEQWSGNFLFYNKKLFAEAGVRPPPGRWEQPWSFGEFLDTAKALTKRDRSGRVSQWGYVDSWVAVVLGRAVRHEQRGPVVDSADEPDAPQLRQRRVHRRHPVLRRSGQQAQGRPHRIGDAVDVHDGSVHLGPCRDGARRALAISRRSTGPKVWISISPCCRPVRKGMPPARTSAQPGSPSPRAVAANNRRGSS